MLWKYLKIEKKLYKINVLCSSSFALKSSPTITFRKHVLLDKFDETKFKVFVHQGQHHVWAISTYLRWDLSPYSYIMVQPEACFHQRELGNYSELTERLMEQNTLKFLQEICLSLPEIWVKF